MSSTPSYAAQFNGSLQIILASKSYEDKITVWRVSDDMYHIAYNAEMPLGGGDGTTAGQRYKTLNYVSPSTVVDYLKDVIDLLLLDSAPIQFAHIMVAGYPNVVIPFSKLDEARDVIVSVARNYVDRV